MDIRLSKSQLVALDILKSGANCFIDGLAGTGKTFLLDYYTKHYCLNKKVNCKIGKKIWKFIKNSL